MAYVLLNTEIGAELEVLKALKKVEGVQEAFKLMGIYDIIARVNADNMDDLNKIVTKNLQVNKVHSKLTVVVTESK
jgi:DNA-binding Lrp family transcriptional regulator